MIWKYLSSYFKGHQNTEDNFRKQLTRGQLTKNKKTKQERCENRSMTAEISLTINRIHGDQTITCEFQ